MEKDFENHISFWHTANDFLRVLPNWMDGPFTLIDGEEMLNNMDKWVRASAKCAKLLTKDVKIAAEELRKRIMDFNVCFWFWFWFFFFLLLLLFFFFRCYAFYKSKKVHLIDFY